MEPKTDVFFLSQFFSPLPWCHLAGEPAVTVTVNFGRVSILCSESGVFAVSIVPWDPITERQMMSKGCTITETKRKVFRFHETILRFGDWIPRGTTQTT